MLQLALDLTPAPAMKPIGIVACCKTKLDRRAPAAELYTSPLFRLSLEYARARCSVVYVASALHGLVELGQELGPYEFTLEQLGKQHRLAWGARFASSLIARHGKSFAVMMLAGELYAKPIAVGLHTHFGFGENGWRGAADRVVLEPLKGKQIGERLAFLSREVAS